MNVPIADAVVKDVAGRLASTRQPTAAPGPSAEQLLLAQPEVLAFVMAGTAHLRPEARSVGVFLAEVIETTFREAGRSARPLGSVEFVSALKKNREMALRVGQAHEKLAERYLRCSRTLHQPALIRYVTGILLEPDPSCPHRIPREELGPLFIVLKSVIDVLDDSARPEVVADDRL
jgi:hypothetical protein